MPEAIVVQGVGKRFRRPSANRPVTLKEAVLQGWRGLGRKEDFWALREVNFSIAPGRMVGVIGQNGAGKSTLLRLIGGVGRPDEGRIVVNGRIGALLDLGAGFHPDLTGRENAYVNGIVAGLTRAEVAERLDAIVSFAELRSFIDSPLRTYSTGMQMRLAFSVAIHAAPEVLLVDEVLAVGDIAFQQKCLDRIADFKAKGGTIVLVSHDPNQIRQLCDEVLWLKGGKLLAHSDPEVVAGQYVADMRSETRRRTPTRPDLRTPSGAVLLVNKNRFGSFELEIRAVRLLDAEGQPITELESGSPVTIEIAYDAPQPIQNPIFGITLSHKDGQTCFEVNSSAAELTLPVIEGQGRIALHLERLDLNSGHYFVDVGIYERNWAYAYDYHWHVYPLHIQATGGDKGLLSPPYTWRVPNEAFVYSHPN